MLNGGPCLSSLHPPHSAPPCPFLPVFTITFPGTNSTYRPFDPLRSHHSRLFLSFLPYLSPFFAGIPLLVEEPACSLYLPFHYNFELGKRVGVVDGETKRCSGSPATSRSLHDTICLAYKLLREPRVYEFPTEKVLSISYLLGQPLFTVSKLTSCSVARFMLLFLPIFSHFLADLVRCKYYIGMLSFQRSAVVALYPKLFAPSSYPSHRPFCYFRPILLFCSFSNDTGCCCRSKIPSLGRCGANRCLVNPALPNCCVPRERCSVTSTMAIMPTPTLARASAIPYCGFTSSQFLLPFSLYHPLYSYLHYLDE